MLLGVRFKMSNFTVSFAPRRVCLTLAPFVDQQRWRFCISGFDPGWEEAPLISFIPKVLVQVGISDLFQGLYIIHWYQVTVQVHELNANLEEKLFI